MPALSHRPDLRALLLAGDILITKNDRVLSFPDVAVRRPIEVMGCAHPSTPPQVVPQDAPLNVVSLTAFAGSSRRAPRGSSCGGRPDGDAA